MFSTTTATENFIKQTVCMLGKFSKENSPFVKRSDRNITIFIFANIYNFSSMHKLNPCLKINYSTLS